MQGQWSSVFGEASALLSCMLGKLAMQGQCRFQCLGRGVISHASGALWSQWYPFSVWHGDCSLMPVHAMQRQWCVVGNGELKACPQLQGSKVKRAEDYGVFVEFQANGKTFTGLLPADEAKVGALGGTFQHVVVTVVF
eukprot:1158800-Pelagomonas_calceolata.AAC.4